MLLEVGMIFVAIGVIMTAWGYNLTLAGYSRKKMLEGISMQTQMYRRERIGNELMKAGIITTAISVFLIFVMFGLFLTIETTKTYPEKVDIITAQGRTVVIADGKVYKFVGSYYHIKRVRLERELNIYGFDCPGSIPKLVIETKDRWERLEQ